MTPNDDQLLVERVQAGDKRAFVGFKVSASHYGFSG